MITEASEDFGASIEHALLDIYGELEEREFLWGYFTHWLGGTSDSRTPSERRDEAGTHTAKSGPTM